MDEVIEQGLSLCSHITIALNEGRTLTENEVVIYESVTRLIKEYNTFHAILLKSYQYEAMLKLQKAREEYRKKKKE